MRNNVDLPQPELPSSAKISLRRTLRLTDCTATVSPKILTMSTSLTNSSASLAADKCRSDILFSCFELGPQARLQAGDFDWLGLDHKKALCHVGRRVNHRIVGNFLVHEFT